MPRTARVARLLTAFAVLGAALGTLPGPAVAATIPVTTTADAVALDADCSLREAVTSANGTNPSGSGCPDGDPYVPGSAPGSDAITLPAGTYTLTGTAGEDDDANLSGDLDVTKSLSFDGAGPASTIIDAAELDRAFDVQGDGGDTSVDVTVRGLTIRNGLAAGAGDDGDGGAVRMRDGNGSVAVRGAVIEDSDAARWGGAVSFANSTNGDGNPIAVVDSELRGNTAGGKGGAIHGDLQANNDDNGLLVDRSTITGSSSGAAGGAIYGASILQVLVRNSTLSANAAAGGGGGVALGLAFAVLDISFSTIVGNSTPLASGGAGVQTDQDVQRVTLTGTILADNLAAGVEVNCDEVGPGDGASPRTRRATASRRPTRATSTRPARTS